MRKEIEQSLIQDAEVKNITELVGKYRETIKRYEASLSPSSFAVPGVTLGEDDIAYLTDTGKGLIRVANVLCNEIEEAVKIRDGNSATLYVSLVALILQAPHKLLDAAAMVTDISMSSRIEDMLGITLGKLPGMSQQGGGSPSGVAFEDFLNFTTAPKIF